MFDIYGCTNKNKVWESGLGIEGRAEGRSGVQGRGGEESVVKSCNRRSSLVEGIKQISREGTRGALQALLCLFIGVCVCDGD
jgi:hypothetical protein